jgi:hypothetical protein
MKHLILAAAILLSACAPAADKTLTSEPSPEGNVGAACTAHTDCETPMDYLIRSSCPFGARCIDGACAVVCPLFDEETNPQTGMNEPMQCTADADCDCSHYAAMDMAACACVDGACMVVAGE